MIKREEFVNMEYGVSVAQHMNDQHRADSPRVFISGLLVQGSVLMFCSLGRKLDARSPHEPVIIKVIKRYLPARIRKLTKGVRELIIKLVRNYVIRSTMHPHQSQKPKMKMKHFYF